MHVLIWIVDMEYYTISTVAYKNIALMSGKYTFLSVKTNQQTKILKCK